MTQSNFGKTGFVAPYILQSGHEGKLGQELKRGRKLAAGPEAEAVAEFF